MGIVFGQRLTIQATASQGSEHDQTVRELNAKFFWVLIALGGSMAAVVIAATAVIWVKDPSSVLGSPFPWVSISATTLSAAMAVLTVLSMCQMFHRLHTPTPEASTLHLRTGQGKAVADVPEFFVAGEAPPPGSLGKGKGKAPEPAAPPPDERSNLLCLERPK